MTPHPKHLRVFLSSPRDVGAERAVALEVMDKLNYDPGLSNRVRLSPVRSLNRLPVGRQGPGQVRSLTTATELVLFALNILIRKDRLKMRAKKTNMNSHRI
jgi:hypothetical protein